MRLAVVVGPPPWPAWTRYCIRRVEEQFPLEALLIVELHRRRALWRTLQRAGLVRGAWRLLGRVLYRPLHWRILSRQQAHFGPLAEDFTPRAPLVHVGALRAPQALEWLRARRPEVVIPIDGGIVGPQLLSLCRWVRWHHGITPDIRGLAAPFWAVYHNRPEWLGITVQQLVEKLDAGPILLQRRLPPTAARDLADCCVKLDELCVELLIEALRGLERGTLRAGEAPDLRAGRYLTAPGPLEILRFRSRQRRFFATDR